MKFNFQYLLFFAVLFSVTACNLEKEVDLNLPEYQRQLMVECYLEPGKPYRLLLTETVGYFDNITNELPIISNATVKITHNGITETLPNAVSFDFLTGKFFNYSSSEIVPADYTNDFQLEIIDSIGRTVTATTKIMPMVSLDSVGVEYLEDSTAFLLTYLRDDPSNLNYYRRLIHKTYPVGDSLKSGFTIDDEVINGQDNQIIVGSPPSFEVGDTAVVSLYHITQAHYDFLESAADAASNNGNPFGQPGSLKTNIIGGQGIFAGFELDQKYLILD